MEISTSGASFCSRSLDGRCRRNHRADRSLARKGDSRLQHIAKQNAGQSESHGATAILLSSALVAGAGIVTISLVEIGPLSFQMLLHLGVMNVLAPLVALVLAGRWAPARPNGIWIAGLLQVLLLWAWHAPIIQQATANSAAWQFALFGLLAVSAVAFWNAVIAAASSSGWRALAVLMLTGKIACLLGALLIFAQHDLYGLPGLTLALCTTGPSTLADQQLAGLLMITACPLSYLIASVVLAAQMLMRIDVDHDRFLNQADGDVAARLR
jgi:putative membrane protein